MIPQYTTEFKQDYLNQISYNLTAFLILKPSLGLNDAPTLPQLAARKALTMTTASVDEIAVTNGYERVFIDTVEIIDNVDGTSEFTVISTFTPDADEALAPFTHICYAYNTAVLGATSINGNNRGSSVGTLIKVEPIIAAPLTITSPAVFTHTTTFKVSLDV